MSSIEVRLLGPLLVRRADGSIVTAGEWRTTKTLDLLRLLALNGGRPMTVSAVIERLWPQVDWDRGRASLRTAASQLRKTLRADCLERRAGSLVLVGAWVDTWAFAELAHEVDLARRAGDPSGVVALARRAEALYAGDVEVTAGEWDGEASDWIRELRLRILTDGAAAAASCGWMRDSLDLAQRARGVELTEEVARTLMRAHAGLGETARALEVYSALRRDLAERLGVDPSAQTRALHVQLLAGTAARQPRPHPVGVEDAVSALVRAVRPLMSGADGSGVVWLCGPEGAGRSTVAALAAEELGLPLHDVAGLPFDGFEVRPRDGASRTEPAGMVVLSCRDLPPPWAVGIVHALAERYDGIIVVRCTECPDGIGTPGSGSDVVVRVGPVDPGALETVARMMLQGEPSPELMRRLRRESSGLAGAACAVLRRWLDAGLVLWREDGLAVGSPPERLSVAGAESMCRMALRTLDASELDTLSVLAVHGEVISLAGLCSAMTRLSPSVTVPAAVGRLIDLGFVVGGPAGYRVARESLVPELAAWIRPSVRERISQVLAATSDDGVEQAKVLDGGTGTVPTPRQSVKARLSLLVPAGLEALRSASELLEVAVRYVPAA
jgi:DNA-binding SARP family transcriptional activator